MRTQYGRKSISRRSVIAAVSVAAFVEVACGSTNVFNDAVFWFRGGKDCVAADGQMRTGEFFDDLHADNTSHNNHKLTVDGYAENGVFQTEEVVFPATGQKKNMQVLHISNVQKDGNRFPLRVRPRSLFANNNISNEYTIVTRVRLDRATSNDWLFRIGYSTARGLLLGFEALSANPGFKQIYGYRFKANDTSSSTFRLNTLVVPTNTWFDLSLAVGNGYARVGIAVPTFSDNNPAIAFQSAAVDTDSLTVLGENYYRFFGETTATSASSPGNTSGFLGSVQQLAVWGRRLSDQEVMSAFGMPRPAIFRIGLANGASNEFGGTRSGASQTIDGLGSWQDVSNTMLAGDTWTVNFNALRDEAGLPQIFSIRSLESSDAASLQASLNGTSLGSRFISANGRGFWAVPENLVVSGANTLTIRRTDGAAGAFLVDSMELGGSIGAGEAG